MSDIRRIHEIEFLENYKDLNLEVLKIRINASDVARK